MKSSHSSNPDFICSLLVALKENLTQKTAFKIKSDDKNNAVWL